VKQIVQSLSDGRISLVDTPRPAVRAGAVLIATRASLISPGTERMLLEFGRANWIDKARQQPDKVRQTLDKIRTDGLAATVEAVRAKLDQPIPLGYCNVGRVIETGAGVAGLAPGDRVISNGPHAEMVVVGRNLTAPVPDGVADEHAVFTVLGAIALQGIRLARPALGEAVVVTGLGLVGLLAVQMLRAQGCRVLGLDPDPARRALAGTFGAETADATDPDAVLAAAERFSRGHGVDAVLIAAATQSDEPVSLAARMSRQRGRIVLIGVSGLKLSRADFFEKELTFQVSHSYGPGRRDPDYEEKGHDYPAGLVRWTEQRNFEAVLDMMADGRLDLDPLISHRFAFADATDAYDTLAGGAAALAILLEYPPREETSPAPARTITITSAIPGSAATPAGPKIGFIGMGNYASRVLLPAFRAAGATVEIAVSAGGLSAAHHGRKHGVARVSSDVSEAFGAAEIDTVVIATPHDSHGKMVVQALEAGKHVWVEKPLCLTHEERQNIAAALAARPDLRLTVGFNRRFAPLTGAMTTALGGLDAPISMIATVNAGRVGPESWVADPAQGGGRIVGEACHFIDILRHLAGHPIVDTVTSPGPETDDAVIIVTFADGSQGTIHYLTSGHRGFAKERIEVFAAGRILQLDNFRTLRAWGWPGLRTRRLWRQDKGQSAMVQAFCDALRTGAAPIIAHDELIEVAGASIDAQASASG